MTRRENNWPTAFLFLAPNFLGFLAFIAVGLPCAWLFATRPSPRRCQH